MGSAGQLHAAWRRWQAGRVAVARWSIRRSIDLRPHVWGHPVATAGRGAEGGLHHARRAADARRAGRAPIRMVDGTTSRHRSHGGRSADTDMQLTTFEEFRE